MSETGNDPSGKPRAPDGVNPPRGVTAGSLLREARQAQGLHIAALAAAIKVTPRKLELLEADRLDELPDATFARALAQSVCRTLRCDPAPVLALLPRAPGHRLEHLGEGLNTPFRDRPGHLIPKEWGRLASPAVWVPALVLLAAAGVYLLPAGSIQLPQAAPRAASAADAGHAPVAAAGMAASEAGAAGTADTAAPTPEESAASDAPTAAAAAPEAASASGIVRSGPGQAAGAAVPASTDTAVPSASAKASAPALAATTPPVAASAVTNGVVALLRVRATAASWVGVTDASGRSLLSREVKAGEAVDLDGAMPMKVTIGNAGGTELVVRGKPLDLAQFTRDNVARFQLK